MDEESNLDKMLGCPGDCPDCAYWDYTVEVDYLFLKWMKQMHDSLKEVSPDHVAKGWGPEIEKKIKEATKNYPKK